MSTVYLAQDTSLERQVAIKLIKTDTLESEELQPLLKRFGREAKALARLSHSNILKILDFGEYQFRPYLVMEYAAGGALEPEEPYPYQEAARLLAPIARALDYAHKLNIIHRDIKPSNILLSAEGTPLLADFGLAKIVNEQESSQLTSTGVGVGTPDYMSPEQAFGENVDFRADIYSLGIVFYQLVTGRKPFQADTPIAAMMKHLTLPPPPPREFVPDLPPEVEQVILRTIEKKPENRFTSMGELASILEDIATLPREALSQKLAGMAISSPGLSEMDFIVQVAQLPTVRYSNVLQRLQEWARHISTSEIALISRDKWNPETPELYIPRKGIELEIYAFLARQSPKSAGFCILGDTGRGKTNLLCRLFQQLTSEAPADRKHVLLFSSAKGIDELAGKYSGLTNWLMNSIITAALGDQEIQEEKIQDFLEQSLNLLERNTDSQPLELLLLIDAINELPENRMVDFMGHLKELLDSFRNFPSLRRRQILLSLIVSCRTFSWRELWSAHEVELRRYFSNLVIDDHGEIQENLFDFDLSTEAREAYERTGLEPAWHLLSEEFREMCCNPFFLHILRTISMVEGASQAQGKYYDVMQRYEDTILLVNRSSWSSLSTSQLRLIILDELVRCLCWDELETIYLPEVVQYQQLVERINGRYPIERIDNTIRELCGENVLELRGMDLRYAFDRFFDFRFRKYLIAVSSADKWSAEKWAQTIAHFHQSEYHRTGVSAALAHYLSQFNSASEQCHFVTFLLSHRESMVASYRELVLEAIVQYGSENTTRLAELLTALIKTTGDLLLVCEITCRVILLPIKLDKKPLIIILGSLLARPELHKHEVNSRALQRNIINMIAGLSKAEQGGEYLTDLLRYAVGIDLYTRQLPDSLLTGIQILIGDDIQSAFSKVRQRMLKNFRGEGDRAKILFRLALITLTTPEILVALVRRVKIIRILPAYLRLLKIVSLGLQIAVKSVFSWFTGQQVVNEYQLRNDLVALDRLAFRELLAPLVQAYENPQASPQYRQDICQNLGFLLGVVSLWQEFQRLFSYSEEGLESLTDVLEQGGGRELAEIMRLLDATVSLDTLENGLARLKALYYVPDCFRNYVGMLTTICQATRDFAAVEDMLWQIMTDPTERIIQTGERSVPEHIKLSREVFSIFVYIIRRSAVLNPRQLDRVGSFIEKFTHYYFTFDLQERTLNDHQRFFLQTELFGREDPFNPLLPLAVLAHHTGHNRIGLGDYPNYIMRLIDLYYSSEFVERFHLIERVLRELIPAVYFAPLPVIGTLEEIIIKRSGLFMRHPEMHAALVATLRNIKVIAAAYVSKMFDYLYSYAANLEQKDHRAGRELAQLISRIQSEAFGSELTIAEVEYLYRSVDVFGGHDTITTAIIEYPNVRNRLVPYLCKSIVEVNTSPELISGILASLIEGVASPSNHFSIARFLFEQGEIPAT